MRWWGKRPKANGGKGHCSDTVFFVEAEVGEDEVGGGGVESDVGVEGRTVALDVDLVTFEKAVSVLWWRRGPAEVG